MCDGVLDGMPGEWAISVVFQIFREKNYTINCSC